MGIVRLLLAISVAIAHTPSGTFCGISLLNSATAVQAFFIISGFLIATVLNERAEYRSASAFYLSRYLRLWPTYIVMAVATPYAFGMVYYSEAFNHHGALAQALVTITNLTILGQDWLFYIWSEANGVSLTTRAMDAPHPQLFKLLWDQPSWTLGIELTFYLIAPFIARSPARLASLFAFGLAIRLMLAPLGLPASLWSYRFAPAEMMLFALGGLAYFGGREAVAQLSGRALISIGFTLTGIIVTLIVGRDVLYQSDAVRALFGQFSQTLSLRDPGFLLVVAVAVPFLAALSRSFKLDAWLGELSYPAYLCHFFVMFMIPRYWPGPWPSDNVLYVFFIIILSTVLYLAIDRPIAAIRRQIVAVRPSDDALAAGVRLPPLSGGRRGFSPGL
jgi:peptidoglycan/LPS O-acetylase OafA/YrhL